jgi:uroporphyrinogen-III synthase
MPCLVTGEATSRALPGREVLVSPEPRAEGLWETLRAHFPSGGDFLLVRGERSRGFLEEIAQGTPWRLHPWITHQEAPLDPPPARPELDAVLALSPLQAETLAPLTGDVLRFAWGARAGEAFDAAGAPAHRVCEPRMEALGRILTSYL